MKKQGGYQENTLGRERPSEKIDHKKVMSPNQSHLVTGKKSYRKQQQNSSETQQRHSLLHVCSNTLAKRQAERTDWSLRGRDGKNSRETRQKANWIKRASGGTAIRKTRWDLPPWYSQWLMVEVGHHGSLKRKTPQVALVLLGLPQGIVGLLSGLSYTLTRLMEPKPEQDSFWSTCTCLLLMKEHSCGLHQGPMR